MSAQFVNVPTKNTPIAYPIEIIAPAKVSPPIYDFLSFTLSLIHQMLPFHQKQRLNKLKILVKQQELQS